MAKFIDQPRIRDWTFFKGAMRTEHVSAQDICDVLGLNGRTATVYDIINNRSGRMWTPTQMQTLSIQLFPDYDPYALYDITESELWDMTYPHMHEVDASEYLRRWHNQG